MSSSAAGVSLFEQISFPATWLQLIIHQAYTRTHTRIQAQTPAHRQTRHIACAHTHTHTKNVKQPTIGETKSFKMVGGKTDMGNIQILPSQGTANHLAGPLRILISPSLSLFQLSIPFSPSPPHPHPPPYLFKSLSITFRLAHHPTDCNSVLSVS